MAIDLLEKKLLETRPYERHAGETDKVYQHYLRKALKPCGTGETCGGAREARQTFDDVALTGPGANPSWGSWARSTSGPTASANENAVREIEALGGEVWMPPIGEWLHYVNYTTKQRALNYRRYRYYARSCSRSSSSTRTSTAWRKSSTAASGIWRSRAITETLDLAYGLPAPLLRRGGHPQHGQIH